MWDVEDSIDQYSHCSLHLGKIYILAEPTVAELLSLEIFPWSLCLGLRKAGEK